ncbi:hydroxypyruvate isomerase family protein [Gilvibacter sp.]|uniref:hydroxypyruvate isomerase family protein n=1 Tax=Gilvibacter sp. TaxID=2729997 RepID=UPI003B5208B1
MERRQFINNVALASVGASFLGGSLKAQAANAFVTAKNKFPLHFAPHDGMFKAHAGPDILDQIQFMADQGFTAFEDNELKGRSIATQEAMAALLKKHNMTMGVFVAHKIYWSEPNLASGKEDYLKEFLADIKDSVAVAKRIGAKWMTVVPGHVDLRLSKDYQTANVVNALRKACEILEPHGLVMVLEPLNFRNHPGLFLTESPQAYQICKAVNSPSCKILFDIYHQQIQEGNLIPNIETCWDEIAYFQIGDNPGRNEPGTGEINYRNVFKYIHDRGFKGVLGMEHGNSMPDKAGEQAVINAYLAASNFD